MTEAGSITALLNLDASGFNKGLTSSINKVKNFVTKMEELGKNSSNFTKGFGEIQKEFQRLDTTLTNITSDSSRFEAFNKMANGVKAMVTSVREFNTIGVNFNKSLETMAQGIRTFINGLGGMEVKLKGVVQAENTLTTASQRMNQSLTSKYDSTAVYNRMRSDLLNLANTITQVVQKQEECSFTIRRGAIDATAATAKIERLSLAFTTLSSRMNTLTNPKVNFSTMVNQSATAYSNLTRAINGIPPSVNNLSGSINYLGTQSSNTTSYLKGLDTTSQQTGNSMNKMGSATQQAGQKGASAQGSFRGLTNVLSSLKNMGMMVASMFAYNFLHSLGQAVSETIKARSEMYSMFSTMGMSQKQIGSFNNALDKTVQQFQRVNKYNLGDTIASMGVEFNLSAKEMEKSMKSVSMITSEYLRAGRNASEASLAVKDVMQGEFQRLSRETGVKGEQLKAAGWSGDKDDVISLMEALEKVGKSRNWDTFATKANSINDILLITQNRFGEWAADISQNVVPLVTGGFSVLITSLDVLTKILGGVGEALHLPDWAGTAIGIGALTTGVLGLIPALITSRTGIGLLEIANKGWKDSILGAVFGLNLEKNASLSARDAILSKLVGVNAEIAANESVRNAILAKIYALDAEKISQLGVRGALAEKVGAETAELLMTRRSITILAAKILHLNMENVARHGIVGAIGKAIAARLAEIGIIETATAAEMEHTAAVLAGTLGLGALVAVLAVAAAGIYAYIKPIMDACAKMKEFNNLVQNGDKMMKEAYDTRAALQKQYTQYTDQLNSLNKGTKEYNEALINQQTAHKNLESLQAGYIDNMSKATTLAKNAQDSYDMGKILAVAKAENELAEGFRKVGVEASNASAMASTALNNAEFGAARLYKALQEFVADLEGSKKTQLYITAHLKESGKTDEEVSQIMSKYQEAAEKYRTSKQTYLTTDDVFEGITAGLSMNYYRSQMWWEKTNALWKGNEESQLAGVKSFVKGFSDAINMKKMFKSLMHDVGVGNDVFAWWSKGLDNFKSSIKKPIAGIMKDYKGLGDFIRSTATTGFFDMTLGENALNNTLTNIGNLFSNFSHNLMKSINFDGISGALDGVWDALLSGGDTNGDVISSTLMKKINPEGIIEALTGVWDYISSYFSGLDLISSLQEMLFTPLTESIYNFILNIPTLLAESVSGMTSFLTGVFGTDPVGTITNFVNTNLIQPFIQSLISLPSQLLQIGSSSGNNFLTGVVTYISQVPGRVYTYVQQTLNSILSGATQWASAASGKASETVQAVVNQVSQLPGKVYNEFAKIPGRILAAMDSAVNAATTFGQRIMQAVLNSLGIHSPGFIQEKTVAEFENTVTRIGNTADTAGSVATDFGSTIVEGFQTGFDDGSFDFSNLGDMSGMLTAFQAQLSGQSIDLSELVVGDATSMSEEAITAFDLLSGTVSTTYTDLDANVGTTMTNIDTTQKNMLNNMQTQNNTAFNNIQTKTNTSLNSMRDSTSKVTQQMTSAWNVMKNNIVSAANQLQTQSTAHFNTLSNHIGTFYRKLQNPSMWGAGDTTPERHYNMSRGRRGLNTVKSFFDIPSTSSRGFAGSPTFDTLPQKMSLRRLRRLVGYSSIFDGLDMDQEVDVREFLSQFGGSFGWNDWNGKHFNRIKTTTGDWNMRGPMIMHRIDTGLDTFHPKEFYNSTPNISFDSFRKMAEALFSAIPYDFYYDDQKHGSWQAALQAGSCNCWHGAHAILALANTCGFSGSIEKGTWNGIPHVYAVIEGRKMDTTGWQQRRSWAGVSAGGPSKNQIKNGDTTVNVTVDMSNATVYGVDDLEATIEQGVNRALNENLLNSLSVGI